MYLIPTKSYFVYIMSNRSKTLYTGVTNRLVRRVAQHKRGEGGAFTSKYKLDRLVYYERYEDVHRAIGREKGKMIDGAVECLNASAWAKQETAAK